MSGTTSPPEAAGYADRVNAVAPLDAAVARRLGSSLVPSGPALSRSEAAAVVAGLRDAAVASVAHAAAVTGLDAGADAGPMTVVDRPTWLAANVTMASALLTEAAESSPDIDDRSRLRQRAESVSNGVQVAGALAFLSGRILGQYLPFGPPRLLLVAPNVARIEKELGVDPTDFRLWVCLHEQTHRLQFARAPWLRSHLASSLGELMADDDGGAPRTLRMPRSAIDVLFGPGKREVFDGVTAAMSLLEGYADVMMDRAGADVIPSVATIRERFDDRRSRGGLARVVNRIIGLDLKLAQYRDGAAFCRGVIDRVGVDGLNRVFAGPESLPTLAEIHAPDAWVERLAADHVPGPVRNTP